MGHKAWDRPSRRSEKATDRRRWQAEAAAALSGPCVTGTGDDPPRPAPQPPSRPPVPYVPFPPQ